MLSLYEYLTTKVMAKKVTITIKGEMSVLRYYTTNEEYIENNADTELFRSYGNMSYNYFETYGFKTIQSITLNDGEENLVKEKGKYIKTKEFFHYLFRSDGEQPLPVHCEEQNLYDSEVGYTIELDGNEEFDIKKLQLVKSDYEIQEYPYWIVADYVMYDGKRIDYDVDVIDFTCYVPKDGYNFEIDEDSFMN